MKYLLIMLSFLILGLQAGPQGPGYKALIGTAAPSWQVSDWLQSPPLEMEDLKGKVVLVRWWTGPYCPYCRNSAAALNVWHSTYKDKGLVVIGMYHHKSNAPMDLEQVADMVRKMGFNFPIGIDRDWASLKRWWLDKVDAGFTSVSFLLDKNGIIRHIHPGGEYIKGDRAYEEMDQAIRQWL